MGKEQTKWDYEVSILDEIIVNIATSPFTSNGNDILGMNMYVAVNNIP